MAFKDFASGLFGGVGSVISGAIGAKTTSDTNKTNLKINQMNNDFNAREAQTTRDFLRHMYHLFYYMSTSLYLVVHLLQ